ncbi:MAG: Rpn family recombination-promoting nuclease/putative transposase [Defluviitaleaceae bacterium]|nr:Rpn family recombination-promoting nuclease/putative transposase [Defluviitaleaceae bacterium]
MLAERNPQFQPTIIKLRELSADEKARDLYERREKVRRDNNMLIRGAKYDIAKNLLAMGDSVEKVSKATGLTQEQIERLQ